MTNGIKILVTCDLHQWIPKWKELVKAAAREKPRFVLIADRHVSLNTYAR